MLTIRCSVCRTKLWKYNKRGKGEVLRCHKARIERWLDGVDAGSEVRCPCGNRVGIDKGSYWKMIKKAFTASGDKVTKL